MGSKPIVLITDHDLPSFENPDLSIEKRFFEEAGCEVILAQCPRHPLPESGPAVVDTIKKLPSPPVAILSQGATISRAVLEAAGKSLKVVGRYGTGTDVIDRDAAKELGIPVRWVPGYSIDEVSDHAIAMLMALHRNLFATHNGCKTGDWSLKNANNLRRASAQVVAILGYGLIGQGAAKKSAALGFQTLAYDPAVDPNDTNNELVKKAQAENVKLVSMDEVFNNADYISIHIPSLPSTKHLVNKSFLENCKPNVSIINTGRGALVDEPALVDALRSGHVKYAALDVREIEPPKQPDPFTEFGDRVILTCHTAFTSIESRTEMKTRLAEECSAVVKGEQRELGHLKGRA